MVWIQVYCSLPVHLVLHQSEQSMFSTIDHDRDHLGSEVVLHFLGRLHKAPACQYLLGTSTVTKRIK